MTPSIDRIINAPQAKANFLIGWHDTNPFANVQIFELWKTLQGDAQNPTQDFESRLYPDLTLKLEAPAEAPPVLNAV